MPAWAVQQNCQGQRADVNQRAHGVTFDAIHGVSPLTTTCWSMTLLWLVNLVRGGWGGRRRTFAIVIRVRFDAPLADVARTERACFGLASAVAARVLDY